MQLLLPVPKLYSKQPTRLFKRSSKERLGWPAVKRARKRRSKPAQSSVGRASFPRWYKSDKNQAVAEWIAWNYYIDKLVGRTPSADLEPYSLYKRETVVSFLAKLDAMTANTPIIAPQGALLTL
jgi:hypothetical protein